MHFDAVKKIRIPKEILKRYCKLTYLSTNFYIIIHNIMFIFQDLLKKLKTNKHITEDALVLDPDLIDLTMIPPPMTPDEVSY